MPMVELIVVLFLILLAITPFLTLYLLGKYGRLREDVDNARLEQSNESSRLRREIAELKKRIAPETAGTPAAAEKPVERPAPAPTKEVPGPPSRVEFPPPVQVPPPAAVSPPMVTAPTETSTGLPAAAKTPADVKPTVPVTPPQFPPLEGPFFSPPATKPPAPQAQPLPPRVTTPMPHSPAKGPAASTRISSPPPISGFNVPAPKPTLQQRLKTVWAIEETLGTNWLNKLGIIILVVGVALFGIYELGALGPLGKAGISYFTAIFLLVGGMSLEKHERYRLIGRGGIGGGWALLFFSTYGIFHVSAMRVFAPDLAWLTVDCALMLFVAAAMALHTLRYRSQFEADREGMYLAVQSGYSPYGSVDLFERFAKLCDDYVIHAQSPDEELSQLAILSLTGYFRSHLLPSERLAQANRIIAQEHWESRKERKPFRVEYEVHNGEFVK
jgi:hypothetical protein